MNNIEKDAKELEIKDMSIFNMPSFIWENDDLAYKGVINEFWYSLDPHWYVESIWRIKDDLRPSMKGLRKDLIVNNYVHEKMNFLVNQYIKEYWNKLDKIEESDIFVFYNKLKSYKKPK